jgi:predicted RNA-binding Zn-ribbon protein involved in translation (DUF1610 family)
VLGESLPLPDKTVLGTPLSEPPMLELQPDTAEGDDAPVRHRESSRHEIARRRYSRRRNTPFECPNCGSREKPELRVETAQVGWIIFVILLLFFFPLCWLGIFMRETWEVCWECGHKVRKVEEATLKI